MGRNRCLRPYIKFEELLHGKQICFYEHQIVTPKLQCNEVPTL